MLHAESHRFEQATCSPDGNAVGVTSNGILHIWQARSWDQIAVAAAQQKTASGQP